MKKTYNVISRKGVVLSATFFFTLFFLGMSSTATAQIALSRAEAGTAVDADLSISQKAEISVSDETAMEIFTLELEKEREKRDTQMSPAQEAENEARIAFLMKAMMTLESGKSDLRSSVVKGHLEMALLIARYDSQIQPLVDGDGIVSEYVGRLK